MKALLSKIVGGPDTGAGRRADPRPRPLRGGLQSRRSGSSSRRALIIEDKYQFKPARPFAPGGEINGVVKEVGEGVTHGQARRPGTDPACAPAGAAWPKNWRSARPDQDPRRDAVRRRRPRSSPTTAPHGHALKDAADEGGDGTCWCWAANGRPGGGRARQGDRELRVIAAALVAGEGRPGARRPARNRAWSIRSAELTATVQKAWVGPNGVDLVYDGVGGDAEAALRSMAWEGRYDRLPDLASAKPFNLALLKGCDIVGVFWGARFNDPVAERCGTDGPLPARNQTAHLPSTTR